MAEAKYSGLPADSQVTRRNFLRAAPAAGLAAMMVGAVPVTAAALAADADAAFHPDWMAEVMVRVREIVDLLQDNAPADHFLQGFEFRCNSEGLIPESIWASAIPDHCRWMAHARPGIASAWRAKGEYL